MAPETELTTQAAANDTPKLRVFISYSRAELEFVDRMRAALETKGIEALVDRDDIEKGEEWWARIKELISEADSVLFVLSPTSVASPVCNQEVEFAQSLNKRFLPVVAQEFSSELAPDALARLNYTYFIPNLTAGASGDFNEAVDQLTRTLETDIRWIREHTRLGSLAQRWQQANRASDLM